MVLYPARPVYLARRLAQANCERAEKLRRRKKEERLRNEKEHQVQKELGNDEKLEKLHLRTQKGFWDFTTSTASAVSDFWTARSLSPRSTSVDSRSSSMNSSLHGNPELDRQEQNALLASDCPVSACELPSSPALPPPPVKLGKVLTFECNICWQHIRVENRIEWQ